MSPSFSLRGAALAILALALGRSPCQAQPVASGRFVVLTDTAWKYYWLEDSLRPGPNGFRYVGEQNTGPSMGGALHIDSLEFKAGGVRLCLEGMHTMGDVGWKDFKQCGGGRKDTGVLLLPSSPLILIWAPYPPRQALFVPYPFCDTAVITLQARGKGTVTDTLELSLWWLTILAGERRQYILPGDATFPEIQRVVAYWRRQWFERTGSTNPYLTLNRHVFVLVREGTVSLRGRRTVPAPAAWLGSWLGRLQGRDILGRLPQAQ